jgi:hypothetical protein
MVRLPQSEEPERKLVPLRLTKRARALLVALRAAMPEEKSDASLVETALERLAKARGVKVPKEHIEM